jgi:hypothetical protein
MTKSLCGVSLLLLAFAAGPAFANTAARPDIANLRDGQSSAASFVRTKAVKSHHKRSGSRRYRRYHHIRRGHINRGSFYIPSFNTYYGRPRYYGGAYGGAYYFGTPGVYGYAPPARPYYVDVYGAGPRASYGITVIVPTSHYDLYYRPYGVQPTVPVLPPAYR